MATVPNSADKSLRYTAWDAAQRLALLCGHLIDRLEALQQVVYDAETDGR